MNLFTYHSYSKFLREALFGEEGTRSGRSTALARHLACQTSYLSRVLKGQADLSQEQAFAATTFFGFSALESDYFLLLVQYERAGNTELKAYLHKKLAQLREEHLNLEKRFKVEAKLSFADQFAYYSSWIYAAVHVLTSIPEQQSSRAIAQQLKISESDILLVLQQLVQMKLVDRKGDKYKISKNRIHLSRESPLIAKHHQNWRLQALKNVDQDLSKKQQDTHYTSVVSVAARDVETIRALWVETFEKYNQVVSSSPEEKLYCLNVDFFEVR